MEIQQLELLETKIVALVDLVKKKNDETRSLNEKIGTLEDQISTLKMKNNKLMEDNNKTAEDNMNVKKRMDILIKKIENIEHELQ